MLGGEVDRRRHGGGGEPKIIGYLRYFFLLVAAYLVWSSLRAISSTLEGQAEQLRTISSAVGRNAGDEGHIRDMSIGIERLEKLVAKQSKDVSLQVTDSVSALDTKVLKALAQLDGTVTGLRKDLDAALEAKGGGAEGLMDAKESLGQIREEIKRQAELIKGLAAGKQEPVAGVPIPAPRAKAARQAAEAEPAAEGAEASEAASEAEPGSEEAAEEAAEDASGEEGTAASN